MQTSGPQSSKATARQSLYRLISAINPLSYLLGYLVLILAMAVADWGLAGETGVQNYYAPYARLERSSLQDEHEVGALIAAALKRNVAANAAASAGWQIDSEALHVYNLDTPQGDELPFTVYLFARHVSGAHQDEGFGGPFPLRLDTKEAKIGLPPTQVCHPVTVPTPTRTGAPHEFDFGMLLTRASPPLLPSSLCWTPQEDRALFRLLSGWRGNPDALSGSFGRMLYFSATTITTTGFGDIIPLSGLARLLTGAEAVAGWVLAGLFLNALAWRTAQTASADGRDRNFEGSGPGGSGSA